MITSRRARLRDAKFMFDLASDPEVRANSFNPMRPTLVGHARFMHSVLRGSDIYARILMLSGWRIGVCTLRTKGSGTGEMGISLVAEFRGIGLGPHAVAAATKGLMHQSGVDRVVARIISTNVASAKSFSAAGYSPGDSVYFGAMEVKVMEYPGRG